VPALVDTNVLVYRFDPRFPPKQARATELLRAGIADDSIRVAHQALIEFVAATTKPLARNGPSLLSPDDARRELEEMLVQFDVLYPDEELIRIAIRGAATYGLSWFDAHMWAYAERFGLDTLWSEDFEDGRLYGRVRAKDPFAGNS
jgi:predicted nucleic acid-binding protein